VQVVAQLALAPVHAKATHAGVPGWDAGANVQVPLVADGHPSAAPLHASHAPPHALSQQKPSMQLPDAQERQPGDLQSAPAAGLQVEPCALRATQVPPGAQ
jgi:hypothetical protein